MARCGRRRRLRDRFRFEGCDRSPLPTRGRPGRGDARHDSRRLARVAGLEVGRHPSRGACGSSFGPSPASRFSALAPSDVGAPPAWDEPLWRGPGRAPRPGWAGRSGATKSSLLESRIRTARSRGRGRGWSWVFGSSRSSAGRSSAPRRGVHSGRRRETSVHIAHWLGPARTSERGVDGRSTGTGRRHTGVDHGHGPLGVRPRRPHRPRSRCPRSGLTVHWTVTNRGGVDDRRRRRVSDLVAPTGARVASAVGSA